MDDEPNAHICLYLFDKEIHCDLILPPSIGLIELAASTAKLVAELILTEFSENPDANTRQPSIN